MVEYFFTLIKEISIQSLIKFFIIIPIYNVESYLHKCLDSIVSQTYKNFNYIFSLNSLRYVQQLSSTQIRKPEHNIL